MKRWFIGLLVSLWASAAAANVPCTLPFNLLNGTTADATQVMANYNALVTCLANAAAAGANNDITSLSALVTPITPSQGGSSVYVGGTSTGSANAQVVGSVTPLNFSLTTPSRILFIAGFTNTGATTLNVNGTGATNVFRYGPNGPVALIGGEIVAGNFVEASFDGTRFILYTNAVAAPTGAFTALTAAATTDISLAINHYAVVNGSGSITSFGSNATTDFPVYLISFGSAGLTLTYNATSLILPGSVNIVTGAGDFGIALYLGSGNWRIVNYMRANGQALGFNPTFIQNYISGLTLSTAGSSSTFGIAAGVAADSTNTSMMVVASAYTKTTASWAVGSGNGCLDTGAIATNTWYTVFEIQRPDTGVIDYVCSATTTPASGPTSLPANYTLFRRIGAMKTNGSSQWTKFFQINGEFIWDTPVTDATASGAATLGTATLSTPPGVNVLAHFDLNCRNASAGVLTLVAPTFISGTTASSTNFVCSSGPGGVDIGAPFSVMTNTSRQVQMNSGTGAGWTLSLITTGWYDYRGQQ